MFSYRNFIIIVWLLLVLTSYPIQAKEKTIYFSTGAFCPLVCNDIENKGYLIDLLTDIYDEIGVKIHVVRATDARTTSLLKQKKIDMFLVSSSSDMQSLKKVRISKSPLYIDKLGVVYKDDGDKYDKMIDLLPLKIPIQKKQHLKGILADFYNQKVENYSWVFIPNLGSDRISALLKFERIDAAIIDKISYQYYLGTDANLAFNIIEDFPQLKNYIAFSDHTVEQKWLEHYEQRIQFYTTDEKLKVYLSKYLHQKNEVPKN